MLNPKAFLLSALIASLSGAACLAADAVAADSTEATKKEGSDKASSATAAAADDAKMAEKDMKPKDPLKGIKCFMMKKRDVKARYAVDFKGAKLYVCCKSCVKRMAKQADRYEANANHQIVLTGQFEQKHCPVTGKPITKDSPSMKIDGVDVFFSAEADQQAIAKLEGKEQIKKVFGKEGFKMGAFELVKKKAKDEGKEGSDKKKAA